MANGNNWCSPYKGWDRIYDNNFTYFDEKYRSQFLGGEAAMWSEQVDHFTLDGRVWPRLSAMAERLWTNPSTGWKQAQHRMQIHRERLVENGIAAEKLAPHWCLQHENNCQIPKVSNRVRNFSAIIIEKTTSSQCQITIQIRLIFAAVVVLVLK